MSFKNYLLDRIMNHEYARIKIEYEKINNRNQEMTGTKGTYFINSEIPIVSFEDHPTKLHPDLRPEVKELESYYHQFLHELDYLNNFLSVLLRSNVPLEVKEAIIPESIIEDYKKIFFSNIVFPVSPSSVDSSITKEYMYEKYAEEIYYLNKYLVYLMIGD